MTYKSIQEIEKKYAEPDNETKEDRTKRLKMKQQAIRRFNQRQQSLQPQPKTSKTTTSATVRKQKSRAVLTDEQKTNILEQNRIRYAAQQEQLRNKFLKIGCCNIDNYTENVVEGDEIENNRHKFEKMNNICNHCYALKWKKEPKGFCCLNGQIVIAPLSPAPPSLHTLLTSNDPDSDEPYVNQIRAYNQVLAFTSIGAKVDKELANAKDGVYTFRIQGALYHRIGGLMPSDQTEPQFAQIYFYDTNLDNQLNRRTEIFPNLNVNILKALQDELHEINPFVRLFTNARNCVKNESDLSDMQLIIHNTHSKDMRQYNQPTASEIAVIMLDNSDFRPDILRDIIIKTYEGELKHISELHGAYDPLQYPLLFPYGEYGWHDSIFRANVFESDHESDHEPEPEPEPESELEPEFEFESESEMEIEEEGDRHTGATQDIENLMIESNEPRFKRDKGKGKAIEIESDNESDNESENVSETVSDNEELSKVQKLTKKRKRVTIREFVIYRIQIRDSNKTKSILHLSGRLFQQYLVDQYAKWESNNLRWHEKNQQNYRSEIYSGLQDIISEEDTITDKIGKKIILSSSFTGSVRYMQQLYQDSMAIVRDFGKPDLFITVTCNPKWPEITNELLPNQQASDRPDLVTRVFKLKLESITKDLFIRGVLGKVIAHVHVIEFQKRGLPHAHILMILAPEDKPKTPEDFNRLVCAEIPDKNLQPKLFETVSRNMIHGPCGILNPQSPCMIDGKCSKHYPREFVEVTTTNKYGYPLYRRRNNNKSITKNRVIIDNRWIVPYNPYLCQKYDCHINVEICSSIRSVKYLYKYVYKGHDRVIISIKNSDDEITNYLNARYVSASEACWRLFNFGLQKRSHKVERLPVHLPNQQSVIFQENENVHEVLEKSSHTKLTRYFEMCANNQDDLIINNLRYVDFPKHFIWKNGNWHQRKRGGEKVVSRLYMCSPHDKERFYLRLLLTKIHGATSYEAVRTINGTVYDTFEETVRQLGLLDEENNEFDKCLKEAATYMMPSQLRQLFASILLFCDPKEVNAKKLLNTYLGDLDDDYENQQIVLKKTKDLSDNDYAIIVRKTLAGIEKFLIPHNKTLEDFSLPRPDYSLLEENFNQTNLIMEELNYNSNELQDLLAKEDQLNADQKTIFDTIIKAFYKQIDQNVFFVDGPGGYGKTFLFNMILAKVRSDNKIAIAVASSGIAALLLNGGRTAHSRFKIPIKVTEISTLNINQQSELAELIKATKLIIWDEAPMAHRFTFEAVDRTFRDITQIDKPFGGIIFVMGGDFRQILPVVIRGTRSHIIDACIKSSNLWKHVNVMHLTINMRIQHQQNNEQQSFVNYLLQVGEGKESTYPNIGEDVVKLHDDMILDDENLELLISEVFHNIDNNYKDIDNYINYIKDRAILTTKNEDVDDINEQIINIFPGDAKEFLSADSVEDKDSVHQNLYPIEFLNTLTPSGTPPHKLVLKVGVPIMLLRNINPTEGLCNGTRLIVKRFQQHVIDAEILTGSHLGKRVFIPRIRIAPSDVDLPFQLIRRQFPVRLAFAMTINKAQGQTIPYMGLDLRNPVFAHGQLYVALSRVQSKNNIKILVKNDCIDKTGVYTKNIVYREIL